MDRPFTIYSDHKPIVSILNKPKTIVPLRIERLILRLQGYYSEIAHINSNENIAHYCKNACPKALTLNDIKQAMKNEKTLQKLKDLILENRWFEIQKESIKSEKEINIDELKIFSRIKDSLAVNDTGDLILRGNRIVLASLYRNFAVNLDHAGHLGLTKTKALLRYSIIYYTI